MGREAYKNSKSGKSLHENVRCNPNGSKSFVQVTEEPFDIAFHKLNNAFFVDKIYDRLKILSRSAEIKAAYNSTVENKVNTKYSNERVINLVIRIYLQELCNRAIKYKAIQYIKTNTAKVLKNVARVLVGKLQMDEELTAKKHNISVFDQDDKRTLLLDIAGKRFAIIPPMEISAKLKEAIKKTTYPDIPLK